jgi:hypothetical protein
MWRNNVMSKKWRQHSAKYKFQVAMEALKGQKTINFTSEGLL